ncbi:hypothetical protein Tco_0794741 [Tanacetum coccineum]
MMIAFSSNLKTRFRKLKSLPTNTTRTANSTSRAVNPLVKSKTFTPSFGGEERSKGVKKLKDENLLSKVLESKVKTLKELKTKVKTRTKTSLSEFSLSGSDSEKSDLAKASSNSKLSKQNNSNSSWSESHLDSETDKKKSKHRNLKSKSFMWRKICLFFSPKKGKKPGNGKGKENRLSFSSLDDEDYIKSFSAKERNKLMNKAMKEEEKLLNKEADKIVKWASDRMMN